LAKDICGIFGRIRFPSGPLTKIKIKKYEKHKHGRKDAPGGIEVSKLYESFCLGKKIEFNVENHIKPYDDTTLFVVAGMSKYKSLFNDSTHKGTVSNIQSCLRLNDLEDLIVSDSKIHLLTFEMLGLFSFNEMKLQEAIHFWMEFLSILGLKPDYVTIHPDKYSEWKELYSVYDVEIRIDNDCTWSDGSKDSVISYCTEFYINDIEIGNIVNPFGVSIDAGFGCNRIQSILDGLYKTREQKITDAIFKIIESGYLPTYNKQGSILRKLLRICYLENIIIDHQFYRDEITRQDKIIQKYNRMKEKPKFKYKLGDREFWMSTLGIDIDLINGIL
jgi:hypothetical protein